MFISGAKAIEILEAYEGTLEDDYPPENERCEHGEMLLYKVISVTCSTYMCTSVEQIYLGLFIIVRHIFCCLDFLIRRVRLH